MGGARMLREGRVTQGAVGGARYAVRATGGWGAGPRADRRMNWRGRDGVRLGAGEAWGGGGASVRWAGLRVGLSQGRVGSAVKAGGGATVYGGRGLDR